MKPGDKLYVVRKKWESEKPTLYSADIQRVGDKTITIARGGLPFGCRTRLDISLIGEVYSLTERAAWEVFVHEHEEAIARHLKDVDELREEARFARTHMAAKGWRE